MKYWFIINGTQLGPIDETSLRNYPITPATPVWREGMAEWSESGKLPELAFLFVEQQPGFGQQPFNSGQQQQQWSGQPYGQSYGQPCGQPYGQHYGQYPGYQPEQRPDKIPDTYLAWSILVTILCCLPFGIPAIVYSSKVSKYIAQGDYARAKNASQTALTWIIVSAVCGVVFSAIYTIAFIPLAMLAGL